MTNNLISASVVLYHNHPDELKKLLDNLKKSPVSVDVILVDNSKTDDLKNIQSIYPETQYIFSNNNLGYGKGHNVAIKQTQSKYHLIINADIEFDPAILLKMASFMDANPDVGLVSPRVNEPGGKQLHFCRKLPTPFDLLARRFLPFFLKPLFKKMLDDYILINRDYSKQMNVPNLPGCFMFVRVDVLKEIGGFDENFFMYVEDVDLTRRIYERYKTIYLPDVEIVHELARGSYKFSKLLIYHLKSAIYYFNKWGWYNDKKRVLINKGL